MEPLGENAHPEIGRSSPISLLCCVRCLAHVCDATRAERADCSRRGRGRWALKVCAAESIKPGARARRDVRAGHADCGREGEGAGGAREGEQEGGEGGQGLWGMRPVHQARRRCAWAHRLQEGGGTRWVRVPAHRRVRSCSAARGVWRV